MKVRITLFFILSLQLLAVPPQPVYGKVQGGYFKKPKPKLTTGTLSITSMPSEASVKIDDRYM